jgi:hypothetical protein
VLVPNLAGRVQERLRRQTDPSMRAPPDRMTEPTRSPAAPG